MTKELQLSDEEIELLLNYVKKSLDQDALTTSEETTRVGLKQKLGTAWRS